MRIEKTILTNLLRNEDFLRKVSPFLKKEYFSEREEVVIFEEIQNFFLKHNKPPTPEIISVEVFSRKNISDRDVKAVSELLDSIPSSEIIDQNWLLESTEKFCKDKALYLAILESISIIEGNNQKLDKVALPTILSDALSVSFDNHVGHDYFEDMESRFDFYHKKEEKIAFDLDMMIKITGGGLSKKSLNVVLASTGAGKSLFMCHVAASSLMQNKNVLYITMEMAEERIAERIDANLMNIPISALREIDRETFSNRLRKVEKKSRGKLIVKEYPTAAAHCGHFKSLLQELKMKRNFVPDLLIIDYLNICSSSRLKMSGSVNSYTFIKSIAEEIRGLAVEYNVPVLTATQTNRNGVSNSDVDITDTSECIWVNEKVNLVGGGSKLMGDVVPGDQITSNDGYKTVMFVHHKKPKDCIKITTKSGKTIIVSKEHVFPTNSGRISYNTGLTVGTKLNVE